MTKGRSKGRQNSITPEINHVITIITTIRSLKRIYLYEKCTSPSVLDTPANSWIVDEPCTLKVSPADDKTTSRQLQRIQFLKLNWLDVFERQGSGFSTPFNLIAGKIEIQ